ncbi:hypothetical protein ACWDDN_46570 [Streptomyces griseoruber]
MTDNKAFKKVVRQYMERTGETYNNARRAVIAQAPDSQVTILVKVKDLSTAARPAPWIERLSDIGSAPRIKSLTDTISVLANLNTKGLTSFGSAARIKDLAGLGPSIGIKGLSDIGSAPRIKSLTDAISVLVNAKIKGLADLGPSAGIKGLPSLGSAARIKDLTGTEGNNRSI